MKLLANLRVAATLTITLLTTFCFYAQAEDSKDESVELMSATRVSKADAEIIEQNHKVLLSNQRLIEKVLTHLKLEYYTPKLPQYRSLGANSLLSLIDQMYYATAAKKLGATMPESYDAPSGSSIINNCYLHGYNNEILRSIAKKLKLTVPDRIPKADPLLPYSSRVISQNHEILTAIAKKLGVKE